MPSRGAYGLPGSPGSTETGDGSGSVTSVALTVPARQSVSGSPVTGSGTLAISDNTQSANEVLAGPTSGSAAAPTFRALVPADYPPFAASGGSHASGAVPDPGASAGTTHFLREDATWAVPAGSLPTLGPLGQAVLSDGTEVLYAIPQAPPGLVDPGQAQYDLYVYNPAAVTAISAVFLGDSITSNFSIPATTATNLSINGLTVTAYNEGVSGTSTTDWNIGGTNDLAAYSAYTSHSCRVVVISLGVNDARVAVRNSVATYLSQMSAIVQGWVARKAIVILNVPTYCVPGSNSGDQDATANTLRIGYQTALLQLCNGTTVFLGDTKGYGLFLNNSGLLTDGIHPGTTGQADLAALWAAGAQAVFSQLTFPSMARAVLGTNLAATGSNPVTIHATGVNHLAEPLLLDSGSFPDFVSLGGDVVVL